jgi:hypothetical protein
MVMRMASALLFVPMLLVVFASLSAVCEASPRNLPTTSPGLRCYDLYQHKALAAAVTSCKAAQGELEPQMKRLNALFNDRSRVSEADERYALRGGRELFLISFVQAHILAEAGSSRSHEFALNAAAWALILTALLDLNDPSHTSTVYVEWGLLVATYLRMVDRDFPGVVTDASVRMAKR